MGVSERTGSEDSHNEDYRISYTVDSTTATYQLMQWVWGADKNVITFGGGQPSWSNYQNLVGTNSFGTGSGGIVCILIDVSVYLNCCDLYPLVLFYVYYRSSYKEMQF